MSTSVEESKAADDPGALAEIALQRATAQAEEGDFAAVLTTLEGFEDSTRSITAKAKRRTLLAAAELRRGVALVNMGRPADAVAHLEHAKSLKPPDDERPALHLQLAIALVGQGQLPVALDELRAGAEVAQGPELSLTHLWTGIALVKSDDPSGALMELEAARTSQPEGVTWPLLPLYTALAFGATRDLEKALEEATAAEHIQSNPYLRALSIVLQASSLVGLGRSGALDCLQRIGLADVKDTDLAEVVAAWVPELLLEARRVDDASDALEAADGIGLDWRASPRLVAVRANVRILQGRIDDALEALDRAEELDPTLRLLLAGREG